MYIASNENAELMNICDLNLVRPKSTYTIKCEKRRYGQCIEVKLQGTRKFLVI